MAGFFMGGGGGGQRQPLRQCDEGLMLETSSLQTFYSGQFTFLTQLLTLNYLLYSPADVAPQFL